MYEKINMNLVNDMYVEIDDHDLEHKNITQVVQDFYQNDSHILIFKKNPFKSLDEISQLLYKIEKTLSDDYIKRYSTMPKLRIYVSISLDLFVKNHEKDLPLNIIDINLNEKDIHFLTDDILKVIENKGLTLSIDEEDFLQDFLQDQHRIQEIITNQSTINFVVNNVTKPTTIQYIKKY